jgi:hypothetical protein
LPNEGLMQKSKNVLFTFDYELFLGSKSGTVENCLLKPTEKLLGIFEKKNIKGLIFFVDTMYLVRLRNEKNAVCKKDYTAITSQLRGIATKGHFIFPHIHAHWIDALYDGATNQWRLTDYSKYRFHHLTESQRSSVFASSEEVMREILGPVPVSLPVNGYRAGGWSIQPFSDFRQFFLNHGIMNEFSVMKGFRNLSPAQYFDFTNCPDADIYNFENDPCREEKSGRFTEYSISTVKISKLNYFLTRVWGKYLWKTGQRSMGDGSGVVMKETDVIKNRDSNLGSASREPVSIESLTLTKLGIYKKFLRLNDYMQFITHPKMISEHNLDCFTKWLDYATENYQLQTDFRYCAR